MGMSRGQDPNFRKMFALRKEYFYVLTDEEFRTWIGMLLHREITSRKDLTPTEVILVNAGMEGFLLMSSHLRDIRGTRRMTEQEGPTNDPSPTPPDVEDPDRR